MKPTSNFQLPTSNNSNQKVAIVHDWLYGGGAEKVVEQLHTLYPDSPIYTSYCTDEWRKRLDNKVVTGYLQNWPFSRLRKFLPLLRQWWFARLDLSDYDLIISSTGNGEAKFARGKKHICYCHSPPHFYWRKYGSYLRNPGFGAFDWLARIGLKLFVKPLRKRDYQAAQQVDAFIANSTHIQADIKKFYNRESVVIHPPVPVDDFKASSSRKPDSPFIYWGRHVPDKRIDIAIAACNELQFPLVVVGDGVETPVLKNMAGPTITFTGRVSDEKLHQLASSAKAFIFPSEEDFGIAPVEALAAGLPIIAYKSGGALDYVAEGKTGVFFDKQTADSLMKVLQDFNASIFNTSELKTTAEKFSVQNFHKKMSDFTASV